MRIIGKRFQNDNNREMVNIFESLNPLQSTLDINTPSIANDCVNHWDDLDGKSLVLGLQKVIGHLVFSSYLAP